MHGDVRVLFVCLGNICRSPMAEAVFRNRVKEEGLSEHVCVSSCGTGDWHVGSPPHKGTRHLLDQKGISYDGMRAKQLDADEIESYDYIVAMDRQNVADLIDAGVPQERINLLSDFISDKRGLEVPDPYFHDNFDVVYELVDQGSEGLLRHILASQEVRT